MKKKALMLGGAVLVTLLILSAAFASAYRQLSLFDRSVRDAWVNVENDYNERAELVSPLIAALKEAASFERDMLHDVLEARRRADLQVRVRDSEVLEDPAAFEVFQRTQHDLGRALARLVTVAGAYPDRTASSTLRTVASELEGTESRIAISRLRFNEASERFNLVRGRAMTTVVSSFFGSRFNRKPYFTQHVSGTGVAFLPEYGEIPQETCPPNRSFQPIIAEVELALHL